MRISDWSSDVCSSDLRSGFGVVSHDPALFALPVPLLLGIALVVFFLALGEADFKLGAAFFPVQVERDKGVAGAFDLADQHRQFAFVQQQFAGARGVGDFVGRRLLEWREMRADQPGFTVLRSEEPTSELQSLM